MTIEMRRTNESTDICVDVDRVETMLFSSVSSSKCSITLNRLFGIANRISNIES